MDDWASFWNKNGARLRYALIFCAIALAVCLVIGLGVHKSEGEGAKAPAVVNRIPIEGKSQRYFPFPLFSPCSLLLSSLPIIRKWFIMGGWVKGSKSV